MFWEQQGIQTFGHRIQITRPQLASQPAFERHFAQLLQEYSAVHAVNLLGQKEGEALLAQAYSQHLKGTEIGSGHIADVGITNFDFHNAVRLQGHDSLVTAIPRLQGVHAAMEKFGFTSATYDSNEPMTSQRGVFRTNCLDWWVACTHQHPNYVTMAYFLPVSIERTSWKTSYQEQLSNSSSSTCPMAGAIQAVSGPFIARCGLRMEMHCQRYTQAPELSTPVSRAQESERWQVRRSSGRKNSRSHLESPRRPLRRDEEHQSRVHQ